MNVDKTLRDAGWTEHSDGRWYLCHPKTAYVQWCTRDEALVVIIDSLAAERDALVDAMREIGDYAHDHSAGPAIYDDLWEVRRMAYAHFVGAGNEAPAPSVFEAMGLNTPGFPSVERGGM